MLLSLLYSCLLGEKKRNQHSFHAPGLQISQIPSPGLLSVTKSAHSTACLPRSFLLPPQLPSTAAFAWSVAVPTPDCGGSLLSGWSPSATPTRSSHALPQKPYTPGTTWCVTISLPSMASPCLTAGTHQHGLMLSFYVFILFHTASLCLKQRWFTFLLASSQAPPFPARI